MLDADLVDIVENPQVTHLEAREDTVILYTNKVTLQMIEELLVYIEDSVQFNKNLNLCIHSDRYVIKEKY